MKHKGFTTRAELLRAAADSIEMQEKAGIEPMVKVTEHGHKYTTELLFQDSAGEHFRCVNDYAIHEFPLAVVEGKPVWEGDEQYADTGLKFKAEFTDGANLYGSEPDGSSVCIMFNRCSWNPPKPKTVMVELPVEDVEYWVGEKFSHFCGKLEQVSEYNCRSNNFYNACKKALEETK